MDYTKIDNTYIAVAKADVKDKIEVEIGDLLSPAVFLPQLKIKRWDNEVNFSVRLIPNPEDVSVPTTALSINKIIWDKTKIAAKFYELTEGEGGYEFEVTLKSKPKTNTVQFSLNTKGLEFSYQPALTQAEIDEGAIRPDNVIGSYAVYCSENKTNYAGGKTYRNGKVGHIYRPKIVDAVGSWVWGDLNIDTVANTLTVTIPQTFLNKGIYPITHAAGLTFGYTSIGATYFYTNFAGMCGGYGNVTLAASILISSISIGTTDNLNNNKTFITDTSYNKISGSDKVTDTKSGSWNTSNYSTNISLASGTYIVWVILNTATVLKVYMDSSGGFTGSRLNSIANNNFATINSPLTGVSRIDNQLLSIYATYTAGSTSAIKTVNGLVKASVKNINGLAIASVKNINGLG